MTDLDLRMPQNLSSQTKQGTSQIVCVSEVKDNSGGGGLSTKLLDQIGDSEWSLGTEEDKEEEDGTSVFRTPPWPVLLCKILFLFSAANSVEHLAILWISVGGGVNLRKILVSVKFVSAILGPEMGAPILWTPGKMRSFCRKNPCP